MKKSRIQNFEPVKNGNSAPKSFEEFCNMFPVNAILQNIRASRRVPKLLLPAYRKTPQAAVWYYLINNKKH